MNITEFSTFLGLVIIKLFLEKWNFFRNYLIEMLKFKEIMQEGKIQNLVETLDPSDQSTIEGQVFVNISLFYNLMEKHVSPILQKETIEIVIKGHLC